MKLLKKTTILVAVICFLTCLFGFSTSAASSLGDPFWTSNVEGYDVNAEDPLQSTGFYIPFKGLEHQLHIADAADPASADYVIEGNYSMYFNNVGDDSVNEMTPMINIAEKDAPQDFKPDKTYVVRFLMKQISPFGNEKANLQIVVRTWEWGDKWIIFQIKDDGEGGLSINCIDGEKMFEKGAIQKVGDDLYEVALRFNGVETTTYNYLFWYLIGEAGFAFDDFKAYESASTPSKAFELEPVGKPTTPPTNPPAGDTTPSEGGDTTPSEGGDTAPSEGGNTDTTTKAPAGNTDTTTKAPATDGADDDTDDQDAAGGLSGPALAALIVAGVVVLGAAAFIIVIVIRRKKGDIAE